QKPAFIKGFVPSTQAGLFEEAKTLLILEGVTDALLPSLEHFLEAFQTQGRVLALVSPESRKIAPYFSRHSSYVPCGFFKNAKDRLALFQFFFISRGEPAPSVPETFLFSCDIEEQFASTCQKYWLLRTNPEACARLCAEATQTTQWDIEMLRTLDPIAAIRLLLARTLKTLTKTDPILKLCPQRDSVLCSRTAILQILLDAEVAFKRKYAPPKSALFQPFL
ncbi:MAG: hypothetical protein LBD15_00305, partial [Holosporales bacterium]|nr:hypothetical protein [Holosporales bacterium]